MSLVGIPSRAAEYARTLGAASRPAPAWRASQRFEHVSFAALRARAGRWHPPLVRAVDGEGGEVVVVGYHALLRALPRRLRHRLVPGQPAHPRVLSRALKPSRGAAAARVVATMPAPRRLREGWTAPPAVALCAEDGAPTAVDRIDHDLAAESCPGGAWWCDGRRAWLVRGTRAVAAVMALRGRPDVPAALLCAAMEDAA